MTDDVPCITIDSREQAPLPIAEVIAQHGLRMRVERASMPSADYGCEVSRTPRLSKENPCLTCSLPPAENAKGPNASWSAWLASAAHRSC